jgi:predicted RNA-binding Zn-ribbon protein involved in translation (DUF1610 family)
VFTSESPDSHTAGAVAGPGSFSCPRCGFTVNLNPLDEMPECPNCGVIRFRRASLFAQGTPDQPTARHQPLRPSAPSERHPAWVLELRTQLEAGRFLAFAEGANDTLVPLPGGWTRIGRSLSADLRLDDPTVSRRHALLVSQPDQSVRVLDDRSLNGICVNGRRIDWGVLHDGDELLVGRFRLHFLDKTPGFESEQLAAEANARSG